MVSLEGVQAQMGLKTLPVGHKDPVGGLRYADGKSDSLAFHSLSLHPLYIQITSILDVRQHLFVNFFKKISIL
jgi:hypothetical protein